MPSPAITCLFILGTVLCMLRVLQHAATAVSASCVIGLGISFTGFGFRNLVSATSFTVVGGGYPISCMICARAALLRRRCWPATSAREKLMRLLRPRLSFAVMNKLLTVLASMLFFADATKTSFAAVASLFACIAGVPASCAMSCFMCCTGHAHFHLFP
jgi:hypothetical protein